MTTPLQLDGGMVPDAPTRDERSGTHGDGRLHDQAEAADTQDAELSLEAWAREIDRDRAVIEGTLSANGKVCATCIGTFVAVKPEHPAFDGWWGCPS